MKLIVDANIVFSGILNTKGRISDILINSHGLIDFIAPDFLRTEIRKHSNRISKISKLSSSELFEVEYQICKDITFISEEQISGEIWRKAFDLVKDVDEKDAPYVAYSMQFNHKIWSGDKRLIRGLTKKGFTDFLTTEELFTTREYLKRLKKVKKKNFGLT